jgi:hypothetical protein
MSVIDSDGGYRNSQFPIKTRRATVNSFQARNPPSPPHPVSWRMVAVLAVHGSRILPDITGRTLRQPELNCQHHLSMIASINLKHCSYIKVNSHLWRGPSRKGFYHADCLHAWTFPIAFLLASLLTKKSKLNMPHGGRSENLPSWARLVGVSYRHSCKAGRGQNPEA